MHAIVELVEDVSCRYMDLSSIPRSPQTFNNFYLNVFIRSASFRVHHTTSHPSLPRAHELQSEGYKRSPTMYLSQWTRTQAGKVKQALCSWAKLLQFTSIMGLIPPWFAFFNFIFFSILILLICFFNCFINSQIINFHNKKIRN